ncbi:HNH endonuclease [Mycobacterium phage Lucky2013]|uniref:HNH endonuclease n=1 Tax=Mycobacterium phage Ariel TaxID=1541824 RepID=UPI0004F78568|nr:HNH endonuclease [Mycobacterium phage Ariel]AIM49878.1 HNH endonuclease [Mycobacterium phage Ariel]ASD53394.1 HNH endonuclease [Mycobacterium phage Lucky2013]ASZ74077.1 HNH endonuclease [Mycobacterium phage Squint]
MEIQCIVCGESFPRIVRQGPIPKYCSDACRNKAYGKSAQPPATLRCEACGAEFQGHKSRKYCTDIECKRARWRERERTRDRSGRDFSYKKKANCDTCGKPVWGEPGQMVICLPCRRENGPPVPTLEELRELPPDKGDGLGWRHVRAVRALKAAHVDGSPCDWCGRPMWLDPTKNFDYIPGSNRSGNGSLQGDHMVSRRECRKKGIPIPLPDRLLHGACNMQRGDGRNDHLAWINRQRD